MDFRSYSRNLKFIASSPLNILILSIYGLSAILIVWSITYQIRPSASGIGMLVRRGEISRVYSPVTGRVTRIRVKQGQRIKKGTIIADIDSTSQRIRSGLSTRLSKLTTRLSRGQIETSRSATKQEIESTLATIKVLDSQIDQNLVLLKSLKSLVNSKEVSYAEYLNQLNLTESLKNQKLQLLGKVQNLEANLLATLQSTDTADINNKTQAELSNYDYYLTKKIVANIDGIVSIIDVSVGDYINVGQSVAQLSFGTGNVKGVFLMSAEMAKKIKPNDECLISPAESPPDRYGYLKGTAVNVGLVPTNPGEFTRRLGLDYTAEKLFDSLQSIEANTFSVFPFLVITELTYNHGSPIWTTGSKPPWGLSSGGAGSVQCFYDSWSPISYIIPLFRKQAGFQSRY